MIRLGVDGSDLAADFVVRKAGNYRDEEDEMVEKQVSDGFPLRNCLLSQTRINQKKTSVC